MSGNSNNNNNSTNNNNAIEDGNNSSINSGMMDTIDLSSSPLATTTSSTAANNVNNNNNNNNDIEKDNADAELSSTTNSTPTKSCCLCYDNVNDAKGFSWLGAGRGALVMSNIFLSSSLLYLSSLEAGCITEIDYGNGTTVVVASGEGGEEETCDNKVYGFSPSSLITNIAVISGVLSALFMPILGAIIDYTPYRRLTGIIAAALMTVIQAVQIYTVEQTWFVMAVLQAVAGFIYQIQVVAVYAYLPDISRVVGQTKMTLFSSRFTCVQFTSQTLFLILIIGISIGFNTSDVLTAQISQGINTVWITIFFVWGWKLMTHHDANHKLPDGHRLLTEGFKQNWNTAKSIYRNYKQGLRWFLLAVVFAEASAAAITTVSVVYLDETLNMDSTQIGIFFLVTLIFTLPGTQLGAFVTRRTNPNTSWKLSMVALLIVLIIGALVLEELPADKNYFSYIWGAFVGLMLGWFYPTENLFFSMCLPKGQEAELAGFFVYCTQILAWLPPLLFTILVEANVAQKWGVIVTSFGFFVAICLLMLTGSWDVIVEEAKSGGGTTSGGDDRSTGDIDDHQEKGQVDVEATQS